MYEAALSARCGYKGKARGRSLFLAFFHSLFAATLFSAVFACTALCVHKRPVTAAESAVDSDTCALVSSAFRHASFSQWNWAKPPGTIPAIHMSKRTSLPAWDGSGERERWERDRHKPGGERLLQNWNERGIFKMKASSCVSIANIKQTRWM